MQHSFRKYSFKKSEFHPQLIPEFNEDHSVLPEENKSLVCSYCKNPITDVGEAIPVNGAHTHTFSNPAGYVYTVSCYRSAPGCLVIGEPTAEFTWFPGHEWQIALCNNCKEQLGWLFTNEQAFYALIAERLILDNGD